MEKMKTVLEGCIRLDAAELKQLNEFEQMMRKEVIDIVKILEERQIMAAKIRHWPIR